MSAAIFMSGFGFSLINMCLKSNVYHSVTSSCQLNSICRKQTRKVREVTDGGGTVVQAEGLGGEGHAHHQMRSGISKRRRGVTPQTPVSRQRCSLFYHTKPCCHEGGIRAPPVLSPHIITVIHQALLPHSILPVPPSAPTSVQPPGRPRRGDDDDDGGGGLRQSSRSLQHGSCNFTLC